MNKLALNSNGHGKRGHSPLERGLPPFAVPLYGSLLRQMRESCGLSLAGFAGLAGVSKAFLSYIERGERWPSWEFIQAATAVFLRAGALKKAISELAIRGKNLLILRSRKFQNGH